MHERSCPLNESHAVLEPHGGHAQLAARLTSLGRARLAARRDRPYLALVALPLAMVAATLAFPALLVPLAFLCWWWGPSDWPWAWLLGIVEACFGVQWAVTGAYCLAAFPRHTVLVGLLWALYALLVAGAGALGRWHGRRYGW